MRPLRVRSIHAQTVIGAANRLGLPIPADAPSAVPVSGIDLAGRISAVINDAALAASQHHADEAARAEAGE